MILRCYATDCRYNNKDVCTKEEIEIAKTSAYDENCAECLEYDQDKEVISKK